MVYLNNTSGENSRQAKLDWAKVEAIREAFEAGQATKKQLAEQYGVSDQAIHTIVSYRTWYRG